MKLTKPFVIILSAAIALVIIMISTIFAASLSNYQARPKARVQIGEIRSAPYPYKSMLAICSDIDGSTLRIFEVVHRYLNTEEDTYLGKGLGLDISDSFWMFAVNDDGTVIDYDGAQNASAMSYFRPGAKDLKNNEEIVRYFNCGWIDSIHSYGDFSRVDTSKPVFTRKHAEIANAEMIENALLPTIWTNHGNSANVQNLKRTFSKPNLWYQHGADPNSQYYHADITIPAGIKYVWFSNPSSNLSVESPIYPAKLQDGKMVWGFNRYTGEKEGVFGHRYNWSSFNFDEQVSEEHLNELTESRGVAIIAQHFGASNGDYVFTGETREGFERLKRYEESRDVLVARTSRLLEFVRTRDYLNYEYTVTESGETITVYSVDDPVLGSEAITSAEQMKGISFNVKNPRATKIFLGNGVAVTDDHLVRSPESGQAGVIGIKWYEKDVRDYTEE